MASLIAISSILDKISKSEDRDYRFMALKDLFTELGKGTLQLERASERKIFTVLFEHVTETNGERAAARRFLA